MVTLINGKPVDLTKPNSFGGVSIQLKPGGSIAQTENGVVQRVVNDTHETKALHELPEGENL